MLKMGKNKNVTFLIKVMSGGGAERVISLLSKATVENGYNTTLILTHQSLKDADLFHIDEKIRVISLPDEAVNTDSSEFLHKALALSAALVEKVSKIFTGKKSQLASILKYYLRNIKEIKTLKNYLKKNKNSVAVAFLYDSIYLTLLSKNKSVKVIASERGDPKQTGSFTTKTFLKKVIDKADEVVFQSPDVQKWYNQNTGVKGTVIFNPVKADLPEPYVGKRNKKIVNFCRIDSQKNLVVLVEAFALLNRDYPEYELVIYGDCIDIEYGKTVKQSIADSGCEDKIKMLPARKDIHEEIKDYAMFVSSSDYEGMSNSMLESMAMGLPCVCTDCPAGGARAVIKHGENGLLAPVNDSQALYLQMKRIVENPEFAQYISQNAVKLREDLSVDKITQKWMEIIND